MGYQPTIHRDPGTVAGKFTHVPSGIILHGSRSGIAGRSMQAEYDGTRRYAASGIELGWNLTCGHDAVSIHMAPDQWGWNSRAASRHYLAVELAQPTVHDSISDGQVRALVWWLQHEVWPRWPGMDFHSLPTHAELEARGETGAWDGKSDVWPVGDWRADALRAAIAARLGGEENPEMLAELQAEVDRLNAELAAERDWSGATLAHILTPSVADLDAALAGTFSATKRRRVQAVRQRLAEWAGVE